MVWSPEAEAEWKEGLLRNTATREDALEEYYCVPKNGGGTYIPAHCVNVRPVARKVLRFTGTPEFNALTESQRRADIREWLETVVRPELEKLPKNLRTVWGRLCAFG